MSPPRRPAAFAPDPAPTSPLPAPARSHVPSKIMATELAKAGELIAENLVAMVEAAIGRCANGDKSATRVDVYLLEWAAARDDQRKAEDLAQKQLGVGLDEARNALDAVSDAQATDEHALARKAARFLAEYARRHPASWAEVSRGLPASAFGNAPSLPVGGRSGARTDSAAKEKLMPRTGSLGAEDRARKSDSAANPTRQGAG